MITNISTKSSNRGGGGGVKKANQQFHLDISRYIVSAQNKILFVMLYYLRTTFMKPEKRSYHIFSQFFWVCDDLSDGYMALDTYGERIPDICHFFYTN